MVHIDLTGSFCNIVNLSQPAGVPSNQIPAKDIRSSDLTSLCQEIHTQYLWDALETLWAKASLVDLTRREGGLDTGGGRNGVVRVCARSCVGRGGRGV